jgi:exonuclease I
MIQTKSDSTLSGPNCKPLGVLSGLLGVH